MKYESSSGSGGNTENPRPGEVAARRRVVPREKEGPPPRTAGPPLSVDEALDTALAASTPRSPEARTGGAKPLAMAIIRVIVAAINRAYRERDRKPPTADPTVTTVLRGIGRMTRARGRQVRAPRAHEVARLLARLDQEAADPARRVIAPRGAAIIAVGFAAALRDGART